MGLCRALATWRFEVDAGLLASKSGNNVSLPLSTHTHTVLYVYHVIKKGTLGSV